MNHPLSTLSRSNSTPKTAPETRPRSYVHKRGNKPSKQPLTRSQRARAKAKTKKRLQTLAIELNERELAQKLHRCSSTFGFLTCGQHEHKKVTNYHCEFRLCPYCAERRSRDLFRKYYAALTAFIALHRVTPVHLVLTQAQVEGETAIQSRARILKAFGKLRKGDFFREHFRGGLWSLEIKMAQDRDGVYHTHLHILALRTKMFAIRTGDNQMRDAWRAVGGGENFRLDPITDLRRGLTEVLKYISKPLDLDRFTAQTLREFLDMKNLSFVSTFGEFRKFASGFEPEEEPAAIDGEKVDYGSLCEGSACPDCAQPLFELRLSIEQYIEYLEGIERHRRPDRKSPPN